MLKKSLNTPIFTIDDRINQMIIYLIITILFIVIIFIFSSPKLSPIPYFPSQKVDLPKIIKALDLKNNQTVFDLGAGDGIVIFKAARSAFSRKLNTKFVAVEINPILILILHFRRLFHPNKKNIRIVMGDIFKIDIKKYVIPSEARNQTVPGEAEESYKKIPPCTPFGRDDNIMIYLYISPWFLEKVISNLIPQIAGSNFSVVSYMYPIKSLSKITSAKATVVDGKNKIFVYN